MSEYAFKPFDKSRLDFDELEVAVLDEMCDAFRGGYSGTVYPHDLHKKFGVDGERTASLFTRLLTLKAIEEYESPAIVRELRMGGQSCRIGGAICEIARQQRELHAARKSRGDLVDSVTRKARSHPVIAAIIIALLVLSTLASLLNNSIQVWQRLNPPTANAGGE